ncbi:MAG: DUF4476 domain-containing protein [Bacteroidota bacterium]
MKKFSTLLLSSLFSLSLLAYDGSRLSISSPGTSTEMKIEVDGRPFSMKNNSLTLSYLQEGRHNVKIYRDKKRNGFGFGKREDVIYQSNIFLKKGFHLDIMVNRFGKVMTDEHLIDVNDDWYNDSDDSYDSNNGGWSGNNSNIMNARDFETVKDQLRKEWFENNRMISVKVIIDKSNFTTQQVKELMLLFTFEQNRLEVAEHAYCKTVDQQNYFQLNEVLSFTSSKEDLARFIRGAH